MADLMLHDMDFHLAKSDNVMEVWSHAHAYSLYLTAWAELYANAPMFGGSGNDSFKIKAKRLTQSGKKMLNLLAAEESSNSSERRPVSYPGASTALLLDNSHYEEAMGYESIREEENCSCEKKEDSPLISSKQSQLELV